MKLWPLLLLLLMLYPLPMLGADEAPAEEGVVRVGQLAYDGGRTGVCFSDGFLDTVARETGAKVQRRFDTVDLASERVFNYPFLVMSGEGPFDLTEPERQNLEAYIRRGGFLLVSAGCSNSFWGDTFTGYFHEMFGEDALQPLSSDHPVFHTIYDVNEVRLKRHAEGPSIYGYSHDDRLRVVYAPRGLNDTANAGRGCCCCGGNEVRNAGQINANVLAYALTH